MMERILFKYKFYNNNLIRDYLTICFFKKISVYVLLMVWMKNDISKQKYHL